MKPCKICGRKLSVYNKTGVCFFHNRNPFAEERSAMTVCGGRPEVRLNEDYRGSLYWGYHCAARNAE